MAVVFLFTLVTLLFAQTSRAFQFQQVFSQFFASMSRVPQFILDTRHPWFEENKWYLARLGDPTEALCSLNSTLRLGNGSDGLQYPSDLFHYLEIDNNRVGISRAGWKNARSRLQEMLECPAALNDVQSFKVQTYIHNGKYTSGPKESSVPPADIPDLFVQALSSMPNLRKLEWNTFGNGNENFKKAFSDANLTLPSVRHLVLAQLTDFLVDACPNVEHLQSGYWRWTSQGDGEGPLIASTRRLSNLTTFGMSMGWSIEHLQGI